MSRVAPIVLADPEGEHLWFDGGLLTIKSTGAQTAGALSLLDVRQPQGKTPPLHVHEANETFYVLEGELLLHIDGKQHRARNGSVVVVPRGTPHTFVVTSKTARMLLAFTPASTVVEDFVRRASQPAPAAAATLTAPPPDPERYQAAAQRSGLEVLGPSPFEAPTPATAASSETERVAETT